MPMAALTRETLQAMRAISAPVAQANVRRDFDAVEKFAGVKYPSAVGRLALIWRFGIAV
jgi:hypothetical protein